MYCCDCSQVHPVWRVAKPNTPGYVKLLRFLCREEVARLRVWEDPLKYADATASIAQVSNLLEHACSLLCFALITVLSQLQYVSG